jgi:histidyl-tRNA synthetase
VFSELDIGAFTIQMNNRKLMRGFFEAQGIADGELQALVLREVDKLDKRGEEHVRATLTGEGFNLPAEAVDRIMAFVKVRSASHADALAQLDALDEGTLRQAQGDRTSDALREGVAELREVLELVRAMGVPESNYALNFSIARGLDYYTGTVYETTLNDYPQIGSICSGGRYENLASHYTKSKLPGVGISIGLTRLFWQLREAGLLGSTTNSTVQALVTQMDASHLPHCLAVANELRRAGFNTEVVMEPGKLAKQFKYADRAGIRFVIVLGEDEIANGTVTVKDLRREDQFTINRHELVGALRVELAQAEVLQGTHA